MTEQSYPHPMELLAGLALKREAQEAYTRLNTSAALELPYARDLVALNAATATRARLLAFGYSRADIEFLYEEKRKKAESSTRKFADALLMEANRSSDERGVIRTLLSDNLLIDGAAREFILDSAELGILGQLRDVAFLPG